MGEKALLIMKVVKTFRRFNSNLEPKTFPRKIIVVVVVAAVITASDLHNDKELTKN